MSHLLNENSCDVNPTGNSSVIPDETKRNVEDVQNQKVNSFPQREKSVPKIALPGKDIKVSQPVQKELPKIANKDVVSNIPQVPKFRPIILMNKKSDNLNKYNFPKPQQSSIPPMNLKDKFVIPKGEMPNFSEMSDLDSLEKNLMNKSN